MTDDVTWKSFKIEGNGKYKSNEPINVSGELQSTMDQWVEIYLRHENEDWKLNYFLKVPVTKGSNYIRTFTTSFTLNKFYAVGKYVLKAEYAKIAYPDELEFELVEN